MLQKLFVVTGILAMGGCSAVRLGEGQQAATPYDPSPNFAFTGNGAAPAVASDDNFGFAGFAPANANNGSYGNDSACITDAAQGWIKIDLGQAHVIDHFRSGRDREGMFDDRTWGTFQLL